jgi:serine/threonine protein kinase
MSVFVEMNPECLELLKRMLEKDPTKRISAQEALSMDYFKNIQLPSSTKKGFLPKPLSSSSDASFKEPPPETVRKERKKSVKFIH